MSGDLRGYSTSAQSGSAIGRCVTMNVFRVPYGHVACFWRNAYVFPTHNDRLNLLDECVVIAIVGLGVGARNLIRLGNCMRKSTRRRAPQCNRLKKRQKAKTLDCACHSTCLGDGMLVTYGKGRCGRSRLLPGTKALSRGTIDGLLGAQFWA